MEKAVPNIGRPSLLLKFREQRPWRQLADRPLTQPWYFDAEPPRPPMRRNTRLFLWLTALALIGGAVAFVQFGLPRLNRARSAGGYPMCSSNLRQIGQAIVIYSNAHDRRLPETLEDLLLDDIEITPYVFVCPGSNDEVVPGVSTTPPIAGDETVRRIRARGLPTSLDDSPPPALQPRYCSYIYVGRGLVMNDVTADTILAYEPLSNHDGDGCHVLFGDGHVKFLERAEAIKLLAPPPPRPRPATASTTATQR